MLKLGLSLGLLGFLVLKIDFVRLGAVLRGVDLGLALLATLVLVAVPAVSIPRWRAILACLGHALPAGLVARALYIGAFFNQVLPSSIGGDGWRIWFCTRAGVPVGTAFSSVIIERLVGLAAVLLSFCATFPLLLSRIQDGPERWMLWLILLGCAAAGAGLFAVALFGNRLAGVRYLRVIAPLGQALARVARSRDVPLLLFTGLLGQAVAIVAFFLVARSVGAPLSLLDCAATLAPGLLVALVPVSLGGWGVREGAFIVLLGHYGVGEAQSLVISLLFGLALVVAGLPGMVLWLGQRGGPAAPGDSRAN